MSNSKRSLFRNPKKAAVARHTEKSESLNLMSNLDNFDDEDDLESFEKIQRRNKRGDVCDDDCGYTAPYVGMLPEETDSEEPSPLNF